MRKRLYKWVEGKLVQIEGPPEDGSAGYFKILNPGDAPEDRRLKAPAVVIPKKHRSAG